MMTMPKLPGLSTDKGSKPAMPGMGYGPDTGSGSAGTMPNIFDELTDDEFAQVMAAAMGGPTGPDMPHDEASETAADEAAESPEVQAEEKAAGSEMHDPQTFATMAQSCASEAAGCIGQIQQLFGNPDADMKKMQKILEEAKGVLAEIEAAAEDAIKAADKDDLSGAAEASKHAEELCAQLEEIKAKAMKESGAPADGGDEAPAEAAPGPGKGPKGGPEKQSPIAVWAKRASSLGPPSGF